MPWVAPVLPLGVDVMIGATWRNRRQLSAAHEIIEPATKVSSMGRPHPLGIFVIHHAYSQPPRQRAIPRRLTRLQNSSRDLGTQLL